MANALGHNNKQVIVALAPSSLCPIHLACPLLNFLHSFKTTEKDHLWLAFGCEDGGGGGSHVETPKNTTSSSHLDAREVVVVADSQNIENNHLQLAFEHKEGGVVAGGQKC